MFRFSSPFVLDLRSLALFRMFYGTVVLYDVLSRLPYVRLFLSDDGALSRADLLATVNRSWSFSLYMLFGEASQVTFILLLHAIVALALVVGFRTRFASIACWVLILSLQHRNALVLNGGDTLLAVYAFWAMFVPLNARWSIDALNARDPIASERLENRYHAVPGAALVLQTVFLYSFTVILKSGELWKSGEAVSYVLRNVGLIKEGAGWLLQYESLLPFISKLTFHWEWIGCVLILFPFANGLTRLVAVFGYTLMHLSFFATLDLALFPFVAIAGCAALLPRCFWSCIGGSVERMSISNRLLRASDWIRSWGLGGGCIMRPGRFASIAAGTAIFLVFVWNVRGLPDSKIRKHMPDAVKNLMYAVKLRQNWGMFAANPPRTSTWYAIEAQFSNGDSIDLFYPSEPYSMRRPEYFSERLPDRRWSKYLSNLKKSKYHRLRDEFIEYLVRRWNGRAAIGDHIQRARLVYFREGMGEGSGYEKATNRVLYTHWAAGIEQVSPAADLDLKAGAEDEVEASGNNEDDDAGDDL